MKLLIDISWCDGEGVCTGIRPDIFEIGDDNIVHLRTEDFSEADLSDLEDAVFLCPKQALRLEL